MTNQPIVSVIIPVLNDRDFLKACLQSLFSQGCGAIEVVVIDNGPGDAASRFIKENYPQVTLHKNAQNPGACRARNQGVELSSADWIMTMDCDVTIGKDFVERILGLIKDIDSNVGIVQPKILNSSGKNIYSAGIFLSFNRRFYDIAGGQADTGQLESSCYVFGACSACALYRRRMLEEIKDAHGYFDERFFFLVEDLDLAWRARKKGWKAFYYPQAFCYHAGASSGFNKKMRQYLCFRNRYYTSNFSSNRI